MQHATVPGIPNGLLVNDIDTPNPEHNGLWKVSYVFDETPYVLSDLAFARKSDAERVRAALQPLIDWSQPLPKVMSELKQRGWTRASFRQVMLEAIQW